MIKRIAVLSFLSVYLCTTVGFAMSLHFCGSKIANIRVNQNSQKPCCSKEKETKSDTCCKDKHIEIKISDSHQAIQTAKIPAASNLDLLIAPERTSNSQSNTLFRISRLNYRGPPLHSNVPLTVQNCNFRI